MRKQTAQGMGLLTLGLLMFSVPLISPLTTTPAEAVWGKRGAIGSAKLHRIAQAGYGKNPASYRSTPLAKKLQGKPVVVDIYASWCPACKNVAPTLSQLKKDYAGKAHFIVFDVSDRTKVKQSAAQAKQLGLEQFLAANQSQTGLVAIIDPATGKILVQHRNNAEKSAYSTVLNAALAKK